MNKHVAYVYFLKNIKNQLLVKVYFDFMCPIKLKNEPVWLIYTSLNVCFT